MKQFCQVILKLQNTCYAVIIYNVI
uniref:Uncharacterized protein n=1 Tax=Anguilla anguilla TaxID=7936 RepID=A0A0E9RVC4_ANGAN